VNNVITCCAEQHISIAYSLIVMLLSHLQLYKAIMLEFEIRINYQPVHTQVPKFGVFML